MIPRDVSLMIKNVNVGVARGGWRHANEGVWSVGQEIGDRPKFFFI